MDHTAVPRPTRSGPRWPGRPAAVTVLGLAGLLLAACGSSSSASTTTGPSRPASAAGAATARLPGAFGTIAAVNGTSFEVQNPRTGQTTVTYTATTTFRQVVSSSAAAVTTGLCISAFGPPTSATTGTARFGVPITASTVSVSQPSSGTCARGLGERAGTGTPPVGRPNGPAPGGTAPGGRRFGGGHVGVAAGQVTAVVGNAVTVAETDPATHRSATAVVTLTGTTAFTITGPATPTALSVGQCACRGLGGLDRGDHRTVDHRLRPHGQRVHRRFRVPRRRTGRGRWLTG